MNSSIPARRRFAVVRELAHARRRLRQAAALLRATPAHPDAQLLEACAAYDLVRARLAALIPGSAPTADDEPSADAYDVVWATGKPVLARLIALHPTTPIGHAMRAAAFLVYDEGELLRRARSVQLIEDRLLAAILVDLLALTYSRCESSK